MLRLPLCVYLVRRLVHATRYPLTQSHSRPYPPPRTHKRNDEGNTPAHLNTKSELSQAVRDHSQGTLPPFIIVWATVRSPHMHQPKPQYSSYLLSLVMLSAAKHLAASHADASLRSA